MASLSQSQVYAHPGSEIWQAGRQLQLFFPAGALRHSGRMSILAKSKAVGSMGCEYAFTCLDPDFCPDR